MMEYQQINRIENWTSLDLVVTIESVCVCVCVNFMDDLKLEMVLVI